MAILRRYICSKHGEFDAWADEATRCPAAKCRCKPREMVSAPAVHRGATASIDKTANQLAIDFNMTNMKSTREGESQSGYFKRNNAPAPPEPRPGDGVLWGNHGRFDLAAITKGGAAKPVRDEQVGFNPQQAGIRRGPTTASYIADHENLKIKPS